MDSRRAAVQGEEVVTKQGTLPDTPKFIANHAGRTFILYTKDIGMAQERAKKLWPAGDFTLRPAEAKDEEVVVIDGRYSA